MYGAMKGVLLPAVESKQTEHQAGDESPVGGREASSDRVLQME